MGWYDILNALLLLGPSTICNTPPTVSYAPCDFSQLLFSMFLQLITSIHNTWFVPYSIIPHEQCIALESI
jgi:hypothetical protein